MPSFKHQSLECIYLLYLSVVCNRNRTIKWLRELRKPTHLLQPIHLLTMDPDKRLGELSEEEHLIASWHRLWVVIRVVFYRFNTFSPFHYQFQKFVSGFIFFASISFLKNTPFTNNQKKLRKNLWYWKGIIFLSKFPSKSKISKDFLQLVSKLSID